MSTHTPIPVVWVYGSITGGNVKWEITLSLLNLK